VYAGLDAWNRDQASFNILVNTPLVCHAHAMLLSYVDNVVSRTHWKEAAIIKAKLSIENTHETLQAQA
jgi:hypothetical protein